MKEEFSVPPCILSIDIEAFRDAPALDVKIFHCSDHVGVDVVRLDGSYRAGLIGVTRRLRHVDGEGPRPPSHPKTGSLEWGIAAVDDHIAILMAGKVGDASLIRRTLSWPLPAIGRSFSPEGIGIHVPGHHPVASLVSI